MGELCELCAAVPVMATRVMSMGTVKSLLGYRLTEQAESHSRLPPSGRAVGFGAQLGTWGGGKLQNHQRLTSSLAAIRPRLMVKSSMDTRRPGNTPPQFYDR